MSGGPDGGPEYGPRGYLPERAARRARKIVLREPLGLGWVVGSLLAGTVLVTAGLFFLSRGEEQIPSSFVSAGPLDQAPEVGTAALRAAGEQLLLVRAGAATRVFLHPGREVVYCTQTRHLEAQGGAVWNLNGRRLGHAGPSLQPLRFLVRDGVVHVDLEAPAHVPSPDPDAAAEPGCV